MQLTVVIIILYSPPGFSFSSNAKMVKYELIVTTANLAQATTTNNVSIKLVGTDGESKRTWLTSIKGSATFFMGAVSLDYL